MRSLTALVPLAVIAAAGSGCVPADVCAPQMRDSLAVMIVDNCLPTLSAGWGVDTSSPVAVLSTPSGVPVDFEMVTSLVSLGGGRLVVADQSDERLRAFGPDARQSGRAVRIGRGPGEFVEAPVVIGFRGDSVAAFDPGGRRITILAATLAFGRSVPLPRIPGAGLLWPVGPGPGGHMSGRVVAADALVGPKRAGRARVPVAVIDVNVDDGQVQQRLQVPGTEVSLARETAEAAILLGKHAALARDSLRLLVATNDDLSLAEYDNEWRLRRILRVQSPPQRVSREVRERYMEEMTAEYRRGRTPIDQARQEMARRMRNLEVAGHLPWVQGIVIAREGAVWAIGYRVPGEGSAPLYRFDRTGILGKVAGLPRGYRLMSAAEDTLLVVHRLESGLERVEFLKLVPGSERPGIVRDSMP